MLFTNDYPISGTVIPWLSNVPNRGMTVLIALAVYFYPIQLYQVQSCLAKQMPLSDAWLSPHFYLVESSLTCEQLLIEGWLHSMQTLGSAFILKTSVSSSVIPQFNKLFLPRVDCTSSASSMVIHWLSNVPNQGKTVADALTIHFYPIHLFQVQSSLALLIILYLIFVKYSHPSFASNC